MKAATTVMAALAMTAVLAGPAAAQSDGRGTLAVGFSSLIDEGETAPGLTFDVHVPIRTAEAMTLGVVGDISFNKLFGEWIKEFAAGVRLARPMERVTPFGQFVFGADSSFGSTDPIFGPAFGVDVSVHERMNVRGQYDLRWLRFAGASDAFGRFWIGVSFRLGD